ncbi:MAG: tRNA 5-methoxyuridine(34)/uridine 5-oxyacetic acid(34) synthase CmoB [Helicobacteraceae bacterium]|nr:tRNA 5-methoxyuridine(34)/uridine 5-oxyacetic acid(34) synthase CmoB [Helicobacteraceae bacterium]
MQLDLNAQNLLDKINALLPIVKSVEIGNTIVIETAGKENYEQIARELMPWRKGPFQIDDLKIDSEWRSDIKYNLIAPELDIEGKIVLDLGCNNGYYLFRMLDKNPQKLIGFDPSVKYYSQFQFLNKFVNAPIEYFMKGSTDLSEYLNFFDAVVCLGVIYHRSDPIGTLRAIAKSLKSGGELYLDSLIIDGESASEDGLIFFPKNTYAKMSNVWFVPSLDALHLWLARTGFKDIETIAVRRTDLEEQRKTEWIGGESLSDFLDPCDSDRTIEGYAAPTRAYLKAKKK